MTDARFGRAIRSAWLLDPDVVFLNNGSFGATPIEVLEVQHEWQRRFEREPLEFVGRHLHDELRSAAQAMAAFMSCRGEDVVFVENATTGINAVLRSIAPLLRPGDRLLTTSHVYNAVRQAMRYIAWLTGAEYVEVPVPFPIASSEEVVERVSAVLTDRTRFAVFDHVTSPTGLIFPVEQLVRLCKERGVWVMIDGAHAPGMVPLDLESLGADWYTGNFHKWLFAPKGCAFLWTAPERQPITHPVVISHGYGGGYLAEFDFTGTKDWSAYLSAPAGLAFLQRLGFERARQYNRTLALHAQSVLAEALAIEPPAPPEMIAYLAAVPLAGRGRTLDDAQRIHDWLFDEHRIEVPVFAFDGMLVLRTASQVYNEADEYDYLADVLARWNLAD
ncbi:MAG: aminotransferase class V-fold PLP-dependent enzyme [Chlorobi bacterium]|nr:aminotransferase class V-fold PLP-dependent enzyme [Chlorobiota bacterium]